MTRASKTLQACSAALFFFCCGNAVSAASISFPTPQKGMASWYGGSFFKSKKTAQGQFFNQSALTAAHRTLPFGTKVLVQSPETHRTVVVTINDRGPFAKHRIIDLSRKAAEKLGILKHGVAPVSLTVLKTSAHPSQH